MYPNNFQRPPLVSRDQYSPTDSRPPGLFGEVDERTRPSTAFSSNNQISHVAGIHEGFTLVHFPPVYPRETDEQGLQHDLPSTNHNSYQPFVPAPQQQPPSSAAVGFIQATLPHGAPQRHYHMSGSIGTPWSSDNRQSMYQSPVTNDIAVHPHIPTQLPFSAARIFGLPVSYQARQSLIADPVLAIRSMSASDQHHTFGISVNVSQLPTGITPNSTVPYHGEALSSMSQTPAGISSSSAKFDADKADIECTQRHYRGKACFYPCRFDLNGSPCNKWVIGDRVRVAQHLRHHHRIQTGSPGHAFCLWDNCTNSKPMKRENLARHVVMHLGVKWKCPHCREMFSRDDAVQRHIERVFHGMERAPEAEVIPGREARALGELQVKRPRTA